MSAITRLSLDGYGARRLGSFGSKTLAPVSGHPVSRLTRLGLDGYGVRRAGSFGSKSSGAFYTLVADPGAFSLTGSTALVDREVDLAKGLFTVTGNPASLVRGTPSSGHPVGQITRLGPDGYGVKRVGNFGSKTVVGAYTLNAATGVFTLSGSAAALAYSNPNTPHNGGGGRAFGRAFPVEGVKPSPEELRKWNKLKTRELAKIQKDAEKALQKFPQEAIDIIEGLQKKLAKYESIEFKDPIVQQMAVTEIQYLEEELLVMLLAQEL